MTALRPIYLANLEAGNVYLHNIHFNVTGHDFKAVHEYIQELYEAFFEMYDAVAELMKMEGDQPAASLKDYVAAMTIEELPNKEITTREGIEHAKTLLEAMRKDAIAIREKGLKDDSFHCVNMMEDHVAFYDKHIWFMSAMLKGK